MIEGMETVDKIRVVQTKPRQVTEMYLSRLW